MTILAIVYDWWRLRHAAEALQRLDDWALKDIGIARDEIRHAVRFGRGRAQTAGGPPAAGDVTSAAAYMQATRRRVTEALPIRAPSILPASRS